MEVKVLIIEDEQPAAEKIIRQLAKVAPDMKIIGVTGSIKESINFLQLNSPDLILSDIHLTDGLSLKIFDSTEVEIPIIFTTAYDKYAIEAFKTYSVDYLLKPVTRQALSRALDKFRKMHQKILPDYEELLKALTPPTESYKTRFLVQSRDQFVSLNDDEIAYFYAEGKYTFIISNNAKKYFSDHNISQLEGMLNPQKFFKINRKYIIHLNSIASMTAYSKSRLKIELIPPHDEDVVVSVDRSPAFKAWLGK